jgi:hypothetical protein
MGAASGETFKYTVTEPAKTVWTGISTTNETMLPVEKIDADGSPSSISIPSVGEEWRSSDSRRFKELVKKRAALEATAGDNREFEQLQQRRRLYEEKTSGEEVLSEWRRRRFVTELVNLLSCNVSFFKSQDQARIRAFGQASRP